MSVRSLKEHSKLTECSKVGSDTKGEVGMEGMIVVEVEADA